MNKTLYTPEYCGKLICSKMKDKGYYSCAIISSLRTNNVLLKNIEVIMDVIKNHGDDISVEYEKDVMTNIESLEKCKNSDCVVFVEKYGETTYKDFYEVFKMIEENRINILGVCAINL